MSLLTCLAASAALIATWAAIVEGIAHMRAGLPLRAAIAIALTAAVTNIIFDVWGTRA